jgi:hypothetical protein
LKKLKTCLQLNEENGLDFVVPWLGERRRDQQTTTKTNRHQGRYSEMRKTRDYWAKEALRFHANLSDEQIAIIVNWYPHSKREEMIDLEIKTRAWAREKLAHKTRLPL